MSFNKRAGFGWYLSSGDNQGFYKTKSYKVALNRWVKKGTYFGSLIQIIRIDERGKKGDEYFCLTESILEKDLGWKRTQ